MIRPALILSCPETRQARFSGLPWDACISQNQVLSRLFVDSVGYHIPTISVARNRYERIEIGWDWLCGIVLMLSGPVVLGKIINRFYVNRFLKPFHLKTLQPLKISFEKCMPGVLKSPQTATVLQKTLGLANRQKLPKVQHLILRGKLLIVGSDLLSLGAKGQVAWWGKNWVTEKLSGKKGFSGEFLYTTETYRKAKSAEHEEKKQSKFLLSLASSLVGAAGLPLLMYMTLKKSPTNQNMFEKLFRRYIHSLNYYNVVYMAKYLLVWHDFFNMLMPSVLAARDSHEVREKINKTFFDVFFFCFGDDLFEGLTARFLQSRYKKQLNGISLYKNNLWGIRLPHAVSYQDMIKRFENHSSPAAKLAIRCARISFWIGLISTSLGLGIALNLVNNWYTKQKVLKNNPL